MLRAMWCVASGGAPLVRCRLPKPQEPGANSQIAAHVRFAGCDERGDLLISDIHPFDHTPAPPP
jgi:hypothetical protein